MLFIGGKSAGSAGGTAPSVAVGVSDSTPNFGDAVTITATPSNITPTSYTFQLPNRNGDLVNVTQASNIYVWTVTNIGTDTVIVTATNGVSSVYTSISITTTVEAPLTSAKAVFDTFKTVTAYAGQCFNVRRTDTSASSDIAFTAGKFDEAAFDTFRGISAATVATMYNQVSNGDLVQATAGAQPPLCVNGDSVYLQGFTNALYRLAMTFVSGLALNETATEYFVIKVISNVTSSAVIANDLVAGRNIGLGFYLTNGAYISDGVNAVRTGQNDYSKKMLLTLQFKNATPVVAINGVVQGLTDTAGSTAAFTARAMTTRYLMGNLAGAFQVNNNEIYAYYMDAADRSTSLETFLMKLHGIS